MYSPSTSSSDHISTRKMSLLSSRFAAWHSNQTSFPLVSGIPPEIRNEIVGYVLSLESTPLCTQDLRMPLLNFNQPPQASLSTPDAIRPMHLSLLQTCRLIYPEAHPTPLNATFHRYSLYDLLLAPIKSLDNVIFYNS